MAGTLDRLAALGNGQVPAVAALAWTLLKEPDVAQTQEIEVVR
jgi:hypothetical protein